MFAWVDDDRSIGWPQPQPDWILFLEIDLVSITTNVTLIETSLSNKSIAVMSLPPPPPLPSLGNLITTWDQRNFLQFFLIISRDVCQRVLCRSLKTV